jgi:hypothetical protein
MDWIERLFGFSPDGGDGSAEAIIVITACVIVAVVIYARVPKVRRYVRDFLGAFRIRT